MASKSAPAAIAPARHSRGATSGIGGLTWRFFVRLKWQYIPLLLSDYTRDLLRRKYDAFATDRAYENRPSGLLGPLGRALDRRVLDFPTHEGLRQRLEIVVDCLAGEIGRRLVSEPAVRVLSAPCGLVRDLLLCADRLRRADGPALQRLEMHGLDLDATGEVIPAAAQRTKDMGIAIEFHREDLFNGDRVAALCKDGRRFHVVNCIGLTPWLDLPDVERLCRLFRDKVVGPGGALVIDNFTEHRYANLARDLEIYSRYHSPESFKETLARCGFEVVNEMPTANRVNTVYLAQAPGRG